MGIWGGSRGRIVSASVSGAVTRGRMLRRASLLSLVVSAGLAVSALSLTEDAQAASPFGETAAGTLTDRSAAGYLDSSGPYPISEPVSLSKLSGYIAGG